MVLTPQMQVLLQSLERCFGQRRAKLGDSLEQIHRYEGQQDVILYIKGLLQDDKNISAN